MTGVCQVRWIATHAYLCLKGDTEKHHTIGFIQTNPAETETNQLQTKQDNTALFVAGKGNPARVLELFIFHLNSASFEPDFPYGSFY